MTTLAWFGHRYDAPAWESMPQVGTPVGQDCLGCGNPIGVEDDGVMVPNASTGHRSPYHVKCLIEAICGPGHSAGPPHIYRRLKEI